jgi:GNAT superfamily N-acetyltransferase
MLAAPTGFEIMHEKNYSYVTGKLLRPTMVIFNVDVKENHYEFANNLVHLIKSEKVGNHYELVKDDILFEALKNSGFSISQQDIMLIIDIIDYPTDFTQDNKISVSVVRTSEELRHWIAINRAYFGELYTDEEWKEIHAQSNVTLYLTRYTNVPAASMLTIIDGSACIELLHTFPDYRKKGLASIMIKQALSDLKAQGVSTVTVQTGAVDLFAKIGFSVVCDKYVARLEKP